MGRALGATLALIALLPGASAYAGPAGGPPPEAASADRPSASPAEAPTPSSDVDPGQEASAAGTTKTAPVDSAPSPAAEGQAPPPATPPRQLVPLPPPPPREPADSLPKGPWYGTFWFEVRPELTAPVAGAQPAKGEIVSGGATVGLGFRLHRLVGLRTAMGLLLHDARARRVTTVFGDRIDVVDYGQILAFEFLGLRAFAPAHPRFLPYLDVSGGMALWFPADGRPAVPGALVRVAPGFEGWVAPRITLGASFGYRLLVLSNTVGHAVQPAIVFGVHW
ncbi:MAG: hypothetical protein D6705_09325 [Deltaproteobacteria bacterium]|nr:MAG: hypothetical protein D6705_09325 [Deltaproteobacteria bacterium]